jgi:hypothetical protein
LDGFVCPLKLYDQLHLAWMKFQMMIVAMDPIYVRGMVLNGALQMLLVLHHGYQLAQQAERKKA